FRVDVGSSIAAIPSRPSRSAPVPYTTLFRSGVSDRSSEIMRAPHSLSGRTPLLDHEACSLLGVRELVDLSGETPDRARCSLRVRSEEHTSELQSREKLVCRLLLENKYNKLLV